MRRRELAGSGGDAALLARLVSLPEDDARSCGIALSAWREARATLERLVADLGLDAEGWPATFQTESVLRAWARLFPRALRTRRGQAGREEYALGGGSGWLLSRDSLAHGDPAPEMVLVLAFHAGEDRSGKVRTWIDAAAPLNRPMALDLDAGRAEILSARLEEGVLTCRLRRKAGDLPLGETERLPESPATVGQILARAHPSLEILEGELERHWRLVCAEAGRWLPPPGNTLDWLARTETRHLETLGVLELRLACPPPSPPEADPSELERWFPPFVESPVGRFAARYDALRGRITLTPRDGKAPPARQLPRLAHWEDWTLVVGKA